MKYVCRFCRLLIDLSYEHCYLHVHFRKFNAVISLFLFIGSDRFCIVPSFFRKICMISLFLFIEVDCFCIISLTLGSLAWQMVLVGWLFESRIIAHNLCYGYMIYCGNGMYIYSSTLQFCDMPFCLADFKRVWFCLFSCGPSLIFL